MSNWFTTSTSKREGALRVSNGGTDALLAVLCLAGEARARTPQQERLLIWLASRDQALLGRGMVGFALSELPWEPATFEADRGFLRAVVAAARARTGWERLGYTPRSDWLDADLEAFAALIEALDPSDVEWDADRTPWLGWPGAIARCPVHGVLEHAGGCIVCNDDAQG